MYQIKLSDFLSFFLNPEFISVDYKYFQCHIDVHIWIERAKHLNYVTQIEKK